MESEDSRRIRFLKLYTAHELAIRAFVRTLVPARDDAHEVMQEVAVVLWRKFSDYPSGEDFRRWAFSVARFEALAWLRDRARERLVFNDEVLQLVADEADRRADRHHKQREALEDCLEKLLPQHRELLQQAYAPGARIDQLAQSRGQTSMSLYKMLHRLRITLLECTERLMLKEGLA